MLRNAALAQNQSPHNHTATDAEIALRRVVDSPLVQPAPPPMPPHQADDEIEVAGETAVATDPQLVRKKRSRWARLKQQIADIPGDFWHWFTFIPPGVNTRRKKFLYGLGKVLSILYAVGCGITTAGSFIFLGLVTGGIAYAIAGFLFICGVVINYRMTRYSMPKLLIIDIFDRKLLSGLSTGKKVALAFGVVLAVAAGLAGAALAYSGGMEILLALGVAAGAAFPPIGLGIIAGITAVCIIALFLNSIQNILKSNIKERIKNYFKSLVDVDPNSDLNRERCERDHISRNRLIAEKVLTGVFFVVFGALCILGAVMTMAAAKPIMISALGALMSAPAALATTLVTLVFALGGELGFDIQTSAQAAEYFISMIGGAISAVANFVKTKIFRIGVQAEVAPELASEAKVVEASAVAAEIDEPAQVTWKDKLLNFFVLIFQTGNAVSNAFPAMQGAGKSTSLDVPAALGNTFGSLVGGVANDSEAREMFMVPAKVEVKPMTSAPSYSLQSFKQVMFKYDAAETASEKRLQERAAQRRLQRQTQELPPGELPQLVR